ncbi:MAG: hypothetical protein LRY36_00760 [Alphaproteobacteria bacterium]|nr:hypothetical protein [Alphaproteobacteria bacterium]
MVTTSHVPFNEATIPKPIYRSLLIDDALREQRLLAYKTLTEAQDIQRNYFTNQTHPLITPDFAREAIGRIDQTTLLSNRGEDAEFMVRLCHEATAAISAKAICTYWDKMAPVVEHLRAHPHVGISFVSNYPHGQMDAKKSAKIIKDNITTLRKMGVKNPLYVDTVMDYPAWMDGRHDIVEAKFKAEGDMCKKLGVEWRPILKVSVHAHAPKNKTYGGDYFRSIYDAAQLAMKYGGNPKASTGQAAAPPYNDFSSKDTGHVAAFLPMVMAIRDFNKQHGTSYYAKSSGGNESELDSAVLDYVVKKLIPDVADRLVVGSNYRNLRRHLIYILEQKGDDCGFDPKILAPYGVEEETIPAYMMGLPSPEDIKKAAASATSPAQGPAAPETSPA